MWLPADRLHRRRTAGGGASASVSSAPSSRHKLPALRSEHAAAAAALDPLSRLSPALSARSHRPVALFFLNLSYWRYFSIRLDVRYAGGVWLVRPDISRPASSCSQSVSPQHPHPRARTPSWRAETMNHPPWAQREESAIHTVVTSLLP